MEKRIQYWLVAAFLVFLIAGCGSGTNPNPGTDSFTVSGKVIDSSNTGLPGITMTFTTSGGSLVGTTTTDADGRYSFIVSNTGGYVITPSKPGYTFTPTNIAVNVTASITGQNFSGTTTTTVNSKLFLASGSALNGVGILSSSNTITVSAGTSITGTIKLTSENDYSSSAVVPVIYSPTWGDRTTSYRTISPWVATGTSHLSTDITLTAPSTAGTYFIIFASSGEMDGGNIASMTNWNAGANVWNDGNDLVDLTESELSPSLTSRYVVIPDYQFADGKRPYAIGCTYIKITVTSSSSPTIQATQRSPLPVGLSRAKAVYVPASNKIYVLGGVSQYGPGTNDNVLSNKIYAYDVASDVWSQSSGTLPYALEATSAALGSNGKIYLSPGVGPTENNGWGTHRKLIEYDPSTGAANETVDLGQTIWSCALVAYQNDIYIFGGWTGSGVNKIWRFTPGTGTLTLLTTTLIKPAGGISAMLGSDNLIYLFNGYSSGYVQIFNPSNSQISLSAAFGTVFEQTPVWYDSNNTFYIGTMSKIYQYVPSTGSLQTSGINLGSNVMQTLDSALGVQLPNGYVFLMGGVPNAVYTGSASVSTNVWELIYN